MNRKSIKGGRGFSRLLVVAGSLVLSAGVALAATRLGGAEASDRGPIWITNPAATPAVERIEGDVRYVTNGAAGEILQVDSAPPVNPSRLMWFQGRVTQPLPDGGSVVLDGAGGIIRVDERLRLRRVRAHLEGRVPVSAAPDAAGGFWVTDATGQLNHVDSQGDIVVTVDAPFGDPKVRADASGSNVWLVRSHESWSYGLAQPGEPLLIRLLADGGTAEPVGTIRIPEHVLLAELANAGHLAVGDGVVYYAPFIRDEVLALSPAGDTLWVAERGLPQSVAEPKFVIEDGTPTIDYAPVNLGVTLGPDGLLYVLSVPGFTTQESRLDVFDPETGHLLRTTRLDGPDVTIAVDHEGRAYALDPFRLMTGVAPRERAEFNAFDLPTLDGGRLMLADLAGKVVLLNFWASWCAPCREEMPALDSLARSITHPDFAFVAMNDDIAASNARDFIGEYGFEFTVVLGSGKLGNQYHYVGLPYTVLLDRQGRVVQQWTGFAGAEQLQGIRTVAEAELLREGTGEAGGHHHGDGN